jgi:hypothetical protein
MSADELTTGGSATRDTGWCGAGCVRGSRGGGVFYYYYYSTRGIVQLCSCTLIYNKSVIIYSVRICNGYEGENTALKTSTDDCSDDWSWFKQERI